MTIRDIFTEIIDTPILELFLYLILLSIVFSFLGWVVTKISESEIRNMYLSKEEMEKKNQKKLKLILMLTVISYSQDCLD